MGVHLSANSYGKSRVRLTKVTRGKEGHAIKELAVDVALEGAFEESYTKGDNTAIVATDSMKNTVYVLAKDHPIESVESFAIHMAEHYIKTYGHVTAATVDVSEVKWERVAVGGKAHTHAFVGGGAEQRVATARATTTGTVVTGGIEDLLVLKTTDSAFKGYIKDKYTTLKETDDRIFATVISGKWKYKTTTDWNAAFAKVRTVILETFATEMSWAVQETIYQIGEKVLATVPEVEEIELTMPNKHRLLVDLKPFGLENKNEIFVPTDEPFGLIRGVMRRG